ncbi:MAG: peroxidase family protein [Kiloniellaceae bacterium]
MAHSNGADLTFEQNWMDLPADEPARGLMPFSASQGAQGSDCERYKGCGKGHWEDTKKMLSRLAVRMSRGELDGVGADIPNSSIPAGFTYFAQMVAHDIVATDSPFPAGQNAVDGVRNYRRYPLTLECLYGAGPDLTPLPYETREGAGRTRARRRLRTGMVREAGDYVPNGPLRDIPRVACPYMSGAMVGRNHAPEQKSPTDDLLADSRNGDNLVLSQLTALFHHFHNRILEDVDRLRPRGDSEAEEICERRNFETARAIVIRTYRDIVRRDLLEKLLDIHVYRRYLGYSKLEQFSHRFHRWPAEAATPRDFAVPMEFSHAAFRFGHAMVHHIYDLNASREGEKAAITSDIVRFTSLRNPEAMPLSRDWTIDAWYRFFKGKGNGISTNPSRMITPRVADGLVSQAHFAAADGKRGGLLYRDLVRGAAVGVRTVASLLTEFKLATANDYPLANPSTRCRALKEWLEIAKPHHYPYGAEPLNEDDVKELSKDPPLLFFILFEAKCLGRANGPATAIGDGDGARLGPLGSMIIAEVVFAALIQTAWADNAKSEDAKLERRLFNGARPQTMGALIDWLNVGQDWV